MLDTYYLLTNIHFLHLYIPRFFNNYENVADGIEPTNILNYNDTNFSDDPGRTKLVFRRGVRHPERIMDSTKSATSVMFAGTARGELLPPYEVYHSQRVDSRWTEGGPLGACYNSSNRGWFDRTSFVDWFKTIVVPHFRRLEF